jgi:penicillin-binding protein 1C
MNIAKLLLSSLLSAAALLIALDQLFPPPIPDLQFARSVVVVARNGEPLRAFADARGVWRDPISIDEVSPVYLRALLNYEDRWFFRHPGVNPAALLRALGQSLWNGRVVSGGSTLTMQVARLIEPIDRSLFGKLKQAVRALQIERRLSKREILNLYLNLAPFGGNIEGVQAASFAYLGKSSARLSTAEGALLAVLPQRPSMLRPDRHPEAAEAARNKVLKRLHDLGVLPAEEVADAMIERVQSQRARMPMLAPHLAQRLRTSHPERARIHSSIDAEWQRLLEQRLSLYLQRFPPATSAAVVVVEVKTMKVRAYVGSSDFFDSTRLGQIDMAQALRSPGSTLKPVLYGLALDAGLIHSESMLIDAPQDFSGYRPGNFHEDFNGPVSAAQALRLSLNVPAVDLMDRVGPKRLVAAFDHAYCPLKLPAGASGNLSIILGGAAARLDQLTGLYAAFHAGGQVRPLNFLESEPSGSAQSARHLMSEGAAFIVMRMLSERQQQNSEYFRTSSQPTMAVKTGTSYGFRDAWAIGSDRELSIGVWIGRPDGTPVPGSFGAVSALPLLYQVRSALPRQPLPAAPMPSAVSRTDVCWPLGTRASETRADLCHQRLEAWVLDQTVPATLAERSSLWQSQILDFDIDREGRRLNAQCHEYQDGHRQIARWPTLAQPWLSARIRQLSTLPPLRPGCGSDPFGQSELRIDGIRGDSIIAPAGGRGTRLELQVRALGSNEEIHWLLNDALVARTSGAQSVALEIPRNGKHRLVALDQAGRFGELSFEAKGIDPRSN